ncbi:MAG: YolD-like family protein [Lachnospiraceae bacterium]|nr:YolD-like family protein [Lachnospiraceae bacterium]
MVGDKNSHAYDDIINLPNPTSQNHPRMPLRDRAAQFSPFAALTGYNAAIEETARLTDERQEPDEDVLAELDEQLNIISTATERTVTITYFVPDGRKSGGAYVSKSGVVKRIDRYEHALIMDDNTVIPVDRISKIYDGKIGS